MPRTVKPPTLNRATKRATAQWLRKMAYHIEKGHSFLAETKWEQHPPQNWYGVLNKTAGPVGARTYNLTIIYPVPITRKEGLKCPK